MVDDTEDTIIRPRRAPRVASVTGVDLDETVLAPRPELVEPPEPPVAARPLSSVGPVPPPRARVAPTERRPSAPAVTRFFRIRLGDAVFSLEAPAFVGRHPSTPRILGTSAVRLVRVVSPNREVSATHASFRQEGGAVVVTDLDSTNGTAVAVPGKDPVVLRQGDSLVVLPGSRVLLGDGVVVEILEPHVAGATENDD